MKDYYEILEVNKNASEDTIKKVFRMLIKKNHPDLFEGDEKIRAENKVKELNEAYEVLINKENREKYNLELEKYNIKDEDALVILMEENEYLKNVIQEKNKLIKEFLKDVGVSTDNLQEDIIDSEYVEEVDNSVDMTAGYNSYKREERIKKIIYMFGIILIGIIALWVVTGINMFKIFIDIFRNMF